VVKLIEAHEKAGSINGWTRLICM